MPARPLTAVESALLPDDARRGPAMKALTPRMQLFAVALLNQGSRLSASAAARAAGYCGNANVLKVTGHRLAHDPRVSAAILELARTKMQMGTLAATNLMLQTVADPTVSRRERLRAADSILDRGGLHAMTEHKVEVNVNDTRTEKILRVVQLARQLGKDPRELLGNLADAMEGDFKVLEEETSPSATAEGNV